MEIAKGILAEIERIISRSLSRSPFWKPRKQTERGGKERELQVTTKSINNLKMKSISKFGVLAFCTATSALGNDDYVLFGSRHFPYEPFGVHKEALQRRKGDVEHVVQCTSSDDTDGHPHDAFHHTQERIMHGVEVAEKMLLHAVEDEVDTLFHDLPKHEKEVVQASSKTVKQEHAEGENEHARKGWWHMDESMRHYLDAMEESYIE